jgi:hypothetical protein
MLEKKEEKRKEKKESNNNLPWLSSCLRIFNGFQDQDPYSFFQLSYGPPWARYIGGYQDRLLGGPLGLPGLRYTAPEGVEHKDCTGVVLG